MSAPMPPPSGDPVHYKLLALCQVAVWGTFFIGYSTILWRRHVPPTWRARLTPWRFLEPFAWALLVTSVAMVGYAMATLLRQVFGTDYWARNYVRTGSSLLLLFAGVTFIRALWLEYKPQHRR